MKNKKNSIILAFYSFILLPSVLIAGALPQFTILTEEWEPYNFKKDAIVQGISTDMLVWMLERIGATQNRKDIMLFPWARAYNMLKHKPGTILFTTTRTEERENMFKWVGPIFEIELNLYALKKRNIKIHSIFDIKKYRIGTQRDDVVESLLVKKTGMKVTDFERVASSILNVKKLYAGRIDLIPQCKETTMIKCKEAGINFNNFESVYTLDKKSNYYAFHKETPDEVISRFQAAFDELKNEGKLDALFHKYKK